MVLSAFGASGFELEARESFFQLNAGLQEGALFLGKPLNLGLMLIRAQGFGFESKCSISVCSDVDRTCCDSVLRFGIFVGTCIWILRILGCSADQRAEKARFSLDPERRFLKSPSAARSLKPARLTTSYPRCHKILDQPKSTRAP